MIGRVALSIALALSFTKPLAAQNNSPVDLTGRWCATTFYRSSAGTPLTEKAEIMIVMTSLEIEVRTSHGSSWTGTYDPASRWMLASYVRNQYTGRVALLLSDDGALLEGSWFNHSGDKGEYSAYRKGAAPCHAERTS